MKKSDSLVKKMMLLNVMAFMLLWQPLFSQKNEAGKAKSYSYLTEHNGENIGSHILDVNGKFDYFYLQNEKIRVNFSPLSSGNNATGAISSGLPMDVVPISDRGNFDVLDWTQLALVPDVDINPTTLKTWNFSANKRNINLKNTSVVNKELIVSNGRWDSSDTISATVYYSLIDNEPIMRCNVVLENHGQSVFKGSLCYMLDPDVNPQFCYLPGLGWGKSNSLDAAITGFDSNYVYSGSDEVSDSPVPAHAIAWKNDIPEAVLYPGYIMGAWFNVEIAPGVSDTISLYHLTGYPSSGAENNICHEMEILAEKVKSDDYALPQVSKIVGIVKSEAGNIPVSDMVLVCKDIEANVVSSVKTDSGGRYEMFVPKGTYTVTAQRLSYFPESRSIEVKSDDSENLDFMVKKVITYASYGQSLNGSLVEGGVEDITIQNEYIAMTIADQYVDNQLPNSTKGKPIDFSTIENVDGFDWMNLPFVSYEKDITENVWKSYCVKFDEVKILETSDEISQVIAKGTCDTIPLSVSTLFSIEPKQLWINASSTFLNEADTTITVWIGDIIDNDEAGETAFYPIESGTKTISDNNVTTEFLPSQPWMGQFGNSPQVFGIIYENDFAEELELFGCKRWIMARKQITIEPGESYTLSRKIAAINVEEEENKNEVFQNLYSTIIRDDIGLSQKFTIDNNHLFKGDMLTVNYSLTNTNTNEKIEDIKSRISFPPNFSCEKSELYISELLPGETKDLSFKLKVEEGGGNALVKGTLFHKGQIIYNAREKVFADGGGWYSGDNHTHSIHSDGVASIAENVSSARNKGLSFMSNTDHNTVSQAKDVEIANETYDDFIAFLGNEVSTNGHGHVVGMFCDEVIPYKDINTLDKAQELLDSIKRSNKGKGMAFIAHPFYPGLEWKWKDVKEMKGFEVWNGFYKPKHSVNAQAFRLWDEKIMEDGAAYLGIANSDGHNPGKISDPYIRVYANKFTSEDIYDGISKGHFYGTDGPDLRFNIGGAIMGDTLLVDEEGESVNISVIGISPQGIDSIRVIKNGNAYIKNKYEGELEIIMEFSDHTKPGDYYRIEVDAVDGTFAFSNPIFIRKETLSSIPIIEYEQFGLYPNPVSGGYATFKMDSENVPDIINLYSLEGLLVKRFFIGNSKEVLLDFSSLAKGIYILSVRNEAIKIIIQ